MGASPIAARPIPNSFSRLAADALQSPELEIAFQLPRANTGTRVDQGPLPESRVTGNYEAYSPSAPLMPSVTGTWAVIPSANAEPTRAPWEAPLNYIYDVACTSASNCWAVGTYLSRDGNVYQTLTLRWDGNSWSSVASPNVSGTLNSVFYGVSCTSTTDCWAVGYHYTGSYNQTLIQHWDGTAWVIVASPNTSSTQHNVLLGNVTCTSASNCWAVGAYHTGTVDQTLITHWDGSSWSLVASPNSNIASHNALFGATCVSASDCWAVGRYGAEHAPQTLIQHWDGASWSTVSSPNSSNTQHNLLFDVTCTASSDCWAVGAYNNNVTGFDQSLIPTLERHLLEYCRLTKHQHRRTQRPFGRGLHLPNRMLGGRSEPRWQFLADRD